jgi:hypothetical protein
MNPENQLCKWAKTKINIRGLSEEAIERRKRSPLDIKEHLGTALRNRPCDEHTCFELTTLAFLEGIIVTLVRRLAP